METGEALRHIFSTVVQDTAWTQPRDKARSTGSIVSAGAGTPGFTPSVRIFSDQLLVADGGGALIGSEPLRAHQIADRTG